jgi:predicted amidohydrolase YtcJ
MNRGVSTVLYPVTDLPSAKAMFRSFVGAVPAQDEPYHVGFRVAEHDWSEPDPQQRHADDIHSATGAC